MLDRNGFGNDSHCVMLTHSNGENINDPGPEYVTSYFFESSPVGRFCYLSGTTKTSSYYKFGGESWSMTGTTNTRFILCSGDTSDWEMGSSDFSIDFYVRINVLPQIDLFGSNGVYQDVNNFWGFFYDNEILTDGSGVTFAVFEGGGLPDVKLQWDPSGSLSLDKWYHCAVTRRNQYFRLFWDGELKDEQEVLESYSMPQFKGEGYRIGSLAKTGSVPDVSYKRLSAYYDEFRISKGICRWTKTFTLPNREY